MATQLFGGKPHKWTTEEAQLMAQKAYIARMERTSPERRQYNARRAALSRWYPSEGDSMTRVKAFLRFLKVAVVDAMLEKDLDTAVKYVAIMGSFEGKRLALEAGMGKANGFAIEVTPDTADKMKAAKAQREKALGISEAEVIDGKEKPGNK